jgi:hypothetical protein
MFPDMVQWLEEYKAALTNPHTASRRKGLAAAAEKMEKVSEEYSQNRRVQWAPWRDILQIYIAVFYWLVGGIFLPSAVSDRLVLWMFFQSALLVGPLEGYSS